jgi:RNA polymerase sigma-70 factor (ECF subfamily)
MTASADEQALIRRAQAGDRTAFEALLNQYYDVIYRIAYKWSGVRADAEDITQNVCIKLARSIGLFGFRSAFLSWLYPLVINTAKDWARQQKAHVTVSDGEIDSRPRPRTASTPARCWTIWDAFPSGRGRRSISSSGKGSPTRRWR